jgi:AraC family transcriptional regulator of adaptative response/methylated-DNA-[protein]-cysteine methyltransferase
METQLEHPSTQQALDYERIAKALHFIGEHAARQPALPDIAAAVHLSEYHFQRLFSRWAGISPQRFLRFLTKEHAKQLLAESQDLLAVSEGAGLSGPGRLHDLFVAFEAMSPGEYRQQGAGLLIRYGWHPTPFGTALLAVTDRGICELSFVSPGEEEAVLAQVQQRWALATWLPDEAATRPFIDPLFARPSAESRPLPLLLRGTNFQVKVWEALLRIPPGQVVSYDQVAAAINRPKAARAVGTAIGSNALAYLIPCHRVIQKVGGFGQYRWGLPRKLALLGWELSQKAGS